jgi:hypothetical protein
MIDPPERLIGINVIVLNRGGRPSIELRRTFENIDLIKVIISAAFHNQPLIIQPIFQDLTKSIGSLLEKGIIYKGDDDQYYFNV